MPVFRKHSIDAGCDKVTTLATSFMHGPVLVKGESKNMIKLERKMTVIPWQFFLFS